MFTHTTTDGNTTTRESKSDYTHVIVGTGTVEGVTGQHVITFSGSEASATKTLSKVRKMGYADVHVEAINGGVTEQPAPAEAPVEQPAPAERPAPRNRNGRKAFDIHVSRKPRGCDFKVAVGKVGDKWACLREDTGKVVEFATKAQRDIAARVPAEWS